jgi:hypothetical protein
LAARFEWLSERQRKAKGDVHLAQAVAQKHTPALIASTLPEYTRARLRELGQKREIPLADTSDIPRDDLAFAALDAIGFSRIVGRKRVITAAGREAAAALPPVTVVIASAVYARASAVGRFEVQRWPHEVGVRWGRSAYDMTLRLRWRLSASDDLVTARFEFAMRLRADLYLHRRSNES